MKNNVGMMFNNFLAFFLHTPPAIIIASEILIGSIIITSSFMLFSNLSNTILDNEKIFFDTTITQLVYSLRSPLTTDLMIFLSFLGGVFVFAASLVIVTLLLLKNHRKEALLFFIIVIMGGVINTVLKFLLQRPRPTLDPLVIETFYSFPSGHSMNSFIFYTTLAYFTYHFTRNKKLAIIVSMVSLVIIFLIGISRIYLGVHYPSDIFGGYLVGCLWFVTVVIVDRTIILLGLFRGYEKELDN